jgi:RNA polymerase sigma-70 factor (ECF subfamily)
MSTPRDNSHRVTELLGKLAGGAAEVREELFRLVENELRQLAEAQMAHQRPLYNLQPTVLIDDAFRKLIDDSHVNWENRRHFYSFAARVMRQLMVGAARQAKAQKRGGGGSPAALDKVAEPVDDSRPVEDLLALEEALTRLEAEHPEWARVVELRFFGGRTQEETAEVLGVSVPTVKNYWRLARGFLHRALQ